MKFDMICYYQPKVDLLNKVASGKIVKRSNLSMQQVNNNLELMNDKVDKIVIKRGE